MDIFIDNKAAEINLDTEKTLGDVLAGIDTWISSTGNRILGISVDGKSVTEEALAVISEKDIKDIKKLEISLLSYRELAGEALEKLLETCIEAEKASFNERAEVKSAWENSAAARFLASDIPDLHSAMARCLSGEGLGARELMVIIEERLREISDPVAETATSESLVVSVAQRMEEFPLDMQTGKEARAAETIQLFSSLSEKLFRIFIIHRSDGLSMEGFIIDENPAGKFIEEFTAALKELTEAYQNRDTVLAGDIAEYELAPRLLKFFHALNSISNFLVASKP